MPVQFLHSISRPPFWAVQSRALQFFRSPCQTFFSIQLVLKLPLLLSLTGELATAKYHWSFEGSWLPLLLRWCVPSIPKNTFIPVSKVSCLLQKTQNGCLCQMVLPTSAVNQFMTQKLAEVGLQQKVHGIFEHGRGIGMFKRHHPELIEIFYTWAIQSNGSIPLNINRSFFLNHLRSLNLGSCCCCDPVSFPSRCLLPSWKSWATFWFLLS